MFELKPLSEEALPAALEKAVRYRLLNEPMQAESICRDVLRVDPDHQEALVTLVLSLTDQFTQRLAVNYAEAEKVVERMADEYACLYYKGILCERRANAHHRHGGPGSGSVAYDWYRRAMQQYESAAELRPPGNDEAILRWNTCVRLIRRHRELRPPAEETFQPMLE